MQPADREFHLMPNPSGVEEDLRWTLQLALVRGVGPLLRRKLLAHFGTAEAVLRATPSELCGVDRVGEELARRISVARHEVPVDEELALCAEHGIQIVHDGSPAYPRMLRELPDPPTILFIQGDLRPSDALAVGIVGSRHATRYGLATAERLAGGLARAGFTIVSGLARGIDAAAHRGALAASGRTLAVLGGGLLNIYPPENVGLAREVAGRGALISEAAPRVPPLGGAFPQRNRIISGLSLGVVVVEASDRSGALITARHAVEQNREVFAVPGRVDSRLSRGCHRLIRDGARLVEGVDDILEQLGPLVEPTPSPRGEMLIHHPREIQLNDVEKSVLAQIGGEPTLIDQVIAQSGMPASQVLATISVLETKRFITRQGGIRVLRIQ